MKINYTWPGRLHMICRADLIYFTIWLFGRRYHRCWLMA